MNSKSGRPGNSEDAPFDLTPREPLDAGAKPDGDGLDPDAESATSKADAPSEAPFDIPVTGDDELFPDEDKILSEAIGPTKPKSSSVQADAPFEAPFDIPVTNNIRPLPDEDETLSEAIGPAKPKSSLVQKVTLCLMTLALFLAVVLYVTHSVHSYAVQLWELSPAYWYVYIAAILLLTVGMIVLLTRYCWSYYKIPSLDQLRRKLDRAERTTKQERKTRDDIKKWVDSLEARGVITNDNHQRLVGKFEETESLEDWKNSLKGYLLRDMDKKAKQVIEREAKAVGVLTALSPYGFVDSVFIFWRNTRLILRVAEIYGSRPGWWGNLKLLRRVLTNVALGAVTQEIMDWYYKQFGGKAAGVAGGVLATIGGGVEKVGVATAIAEPGTGTGMFIAGRTLKIGGRMAADVGEKLVGPLLQGFLSGLLTIRMGLAAQQECRLLSMSDDERKQCSAGLLSTLWNIFPSKKKDRKKAKQDKAKESQAKDDGP